MDALSISRRNFLKTSLQTSLCAAVWAVLPSAHALGMTSRAKSLLSGTTRGLAASALPIAVLDASETSSKDFNGDEIDRPHDLLWHKVSYLASKGGMPPVSETFDTVVIGGGIAGLMAAYRLRDMNTLILEQSPRFGGNSKGEKYENAEFSIGAAYITAPEKGDEIETLLKEIGVWDRLRPESGDDMNVNFRGQRAHGFWNGATDPARASEFQAALKEFKRIYDEEFPDIPRTGQNAISDDEFFALDKQTFEDWLNQKFGDIHPHIKEFCQLYAWSSFGGSIDEISAAQMLNFLTSDLNGTLAIPGGNAAIAQALCEKLSQSLPSGNMRSGTFVIDVTVDETGVTVCYEDASKTLKTIRARGCVFASPKYVARYAVNGIPQDQVNAMLNIRHRAYLVANLILNHPVSSPGYEMFCLEGEVPERPMPLRPEKRAFTDVCFGTWAAQDQTKNGVLTIYKALPYDGARQFLFNPNAHDKHRGRIEKGIPEFLKSIGLDETSVKGIRMTRWGHSIPWAAQGTLASGVPQLASRPLQGRLFFAGQDNWANPCFETSVATAEEAARLARAAI